MAKRGTSEAPYEDVTGFKLMLVEELQNDFSAMLLDPHYALPVGMNVLSPTKGLIVTLEDFDFPGDGWRPALCRDRRLVRREDQAGRRRCGESAGLVLGQMPARPSIRPSRTSQRGSGTHAPAMTYRSSSNCSCIRARRSEPDDPVHRDGGQEI